MWRYGSSSPHGSTGCWRRSSMKHLTTRYMAWSQNMGNETVAECLSSLSRLQSVPEAVMSLQPTIQKCWQNKQQVVSLIIRSKFFMGNCLVADSSHKFLLWMTTCQLGSSQVVFRWSQMWRSSVGPVCSLLMAVSSMRYVLVHFSPDSWQILFFCFYDSCYLSKNKNKSCPKWHSHRRKLTVIWSLRSTYGSHRWMWSCLPQVTTTASPSCPQPCRLNVATDCVSTNTCSFLDSLSQRWLWWASFMA